MEWAFFAVFAVVAAMLFNFINPKLMNMSWAQTPGASSYIGKTLVTGVSFFVVLVAAGVLMGIALGKRSVENPAA